MPRDRSSGDASGEQHHPARFGTSGPVTVIGVAGDLELSSSSELRKLLVYELSRSLHVILDLSRVTFMTALSWARSARGAGQSSIAAASVSPKRRLR